MLPPVDTQNCCSISHASCGPTELDLEQEPGGEEAAAEEGETEKEAAEGRSQCQQDPVRMSCEVRDLSNGRTHTAVRPAYHSHAINTRFRSMHAREKKATQMLAIVLGK